MLSAYVAKGYVKTAKRVANMQDERTCLATAIYHEARGEPEAGQWAVADVISQPRRLRALSRLDLRRRLPERRSRQIQVPVLLRLRRQAGRGRVGNRMVRESWVRAYMIAEAALQQSQIGVRADTVPDSALFYHTVTVQPSWADKLQARRLDRQPRLLRRRNRSASGKVRSGFPVRVRDHQALGAFRESAKRFPGSSARPPSTWRTQGKCEAVSRFECATPSRKEQAIPVVLRIGAIA